MILYNAIPCNIILHQVAVLYFTVLRYTEVYCTFFYSSYQMHFTFYNLWHGLLLWCIILYRIVLNTECAVWYCMVLLCTVSYWSDFNYMASYSFVLFHIMFYCKVQYCNLMQYDVPTFSKSLLLLARSANSNKTLHFAFGGIILHQVAVLYFTVSRYAELYCICFIHLIKLHFTFYNLWHGILL